MSAETVALIILLRLETTMHNYYTLWKSFLPTVISESEEKKQRILLE